MLLGCLEVAFGEPKVVEGKPVIETLHQAAYLMNDIFISFNGLGLLS